MFDFSFFEILLVAVIMLVVIGPDKLPSLFRKIGHYLRVLRKGIANIEKQIDRDDKNG